MTELKLNIIMFAIAAFLLYHLLGSCGCGNGFSVGGEDNACILGKPCGKSKEEKCIGINNDGWIPPSILTNCNVLSWNPSTETCQIPGASDNKYITINKIDYNCKSPY